jgi:hypothetical protein
MPRMGNPVIVERFPHHNLVGSGINSYPARRRSIISRNSATPVSVYYVVTEYGKARLRGKSSWERAESLIAWPIPTLGMI